MAGQGEIEPIVFDPDAASVYNSPGGRNRHATWGYSQGRFWLYGGQNDATGDLGDMWVMEY